LNDEHADAEEAQRIPPRSTLPRIEFGRSKRGDYVYYIALISAALASWIVRILPRVVTTAIALGISRLSYRMSRGFRENVFSNLSHVFDLPADAPELVPYARSIFRTNALNGADLLHIPHMNREDYEKLIVLREGAWQTLDAAAASGKGAIIITAHLGPFDLVASALKVRGYPLSALTARTTNRFPFHAVTFLRSAQHMRVIETSSGGLRDVIRLLGRGEMIVLLSDRDFFLSGRETMFFDEPTTLPIGAVRLARDTGAPIIPFFAHRGNRQNSLVIREPIIVPRTDDKDADVAAGLDLVARELERAIRESPDQWVLFQRAWPEDHREESKAH
jgi:KDO2-lipid IV(A) lauroyltransferase